MRHFAELLKSQNYIVNYVKLDATDNSNSFITEISKLHQKYNFSKIIITEPSEYRLYESVNYWPKKLNIELDIREDDRFLCSLTEFKKWAADNVILLELDFPRRKKLPMQIRQQNANLQKAFSITGYPIFFDIF